MVGPLYGDLEVLDRTPAALAAYLQQLLPQPAPAQRDVLPEGAVRLEAPEQGISPELKEAFLQGTLGGAAAGAARRGGELVPYELGAREAQEALNRSRSPSSVADDALRWARSGYQNEPPEVSAARRAYLNQYEDMLPTSTDMYADEFPGIRRSFRSAGGYEYELSPEERRQLNEYKRLHRERFPGEPVIGEGSRSGSRGLRHTALFSPNLDPGDYSGSREAMRVRPSHPLYGDPGAERAARAQMWQDTVGRKLDTRGKWFSPTSYDSSDPWLRPSSPDLPSRIQGATISDLKARGILPEQTGYEPRFKETALRPHPDVSGRIGGPGSLEEDLDSSRRFRSSLYDQTVGDAQRGFALGEAEEAAENMRRIAARRDAAKRMVKSGLKGMVNPVNIAADALLGGTVGAAAAGAGHLAGGGARESAGLFTPPGEGYEGLFRPEDIERVAEQKELQRRMRREDLLREAIDRYGIQEVMHSLPRGVDLETARVEDIANILGPLR